jgi:hypothetical protein
MRFLYKRRAFITLLGGVAVWPFAAIRSATEIGRSRADRGSQQGQ